jgi:hypothetical protein
VTQLLLDDGINPAVALEIPAWPTSPLDPALLFAALQVTPVDWTRAADKDLTQRGARRVHHRGTY